MTVYDVTSWKMRGRKTDAHEDIGAVINSILDDVRSSQRDPESKPGAVIYIPPGDYTLRTRVLIDLSNITIRGSGHGFSSLSIRYNTADVSGWHELNPGSSHVRVENSDGNSEAFLVSRDGAPRIGAVIFENFCLDGVSFGDDENSYVNGKTGIRFATDNDACRVRDMGMVYLEHGLVVQGADALDVSGNFLTECGNAVELRGAGQACRVNDNHIGAGPYGYSVLAENHNGLLLTGNNIFPRGIDSVHLVDCYRSNISSNRLHSFYPGMVTLAGTCKENLISSNVLERQVEGFPPFVDVSNGLPDDFGAIHVNGDGNTITSNHVTLIIPPEKVSPAGARPAIIRIARGDQNMVGVNHVISNLDVAAVRLDAGTTNSHVFDSGTEAQFETESDSYGFRPMP